MISTLSSTQRRIFDKPLRPVDTTLTLLECALGFCGLRPIFVRPVERPRGPRTTGSGSPGSANKLTVVLTKTTRRLDSQTNVVTSKTLAPTLVRKRLTLNHVDPKASYFFHYSLPPA